MHQLSFDLNGILANSKKAAIVLRALNNKVRHRILLQLMDAPKTTVTQLYKALNMEQSVASQHLAVLRTAGIVHAERDGKFIYYSIDVETMKTVNDLSLSLILCMPKRTGATTQMLRQSA